MRNLTATAPLVHHRGFRRTAVDYEGATAPCPDVSDGQTNQIDVLIEWFAITERVGSGCCCTLCQNDDETRKRNRHNKSNIAPGNIGQPQMRKPATHSANHL